MSARTRALQLLRAQRCKTLRQLQSIHAQLTVDGLLLLSSSAFPFNLLIRTSLHLLLPVLSLSLFSFMLRRSILPDSHSFPFALKASSLLPSPLSSLLGRSLHSLSLRSGLSSHPFVANSLISMYSTSSLLQEARRVFDLSPLRDVVTYNTIIDCYVKAGHIAIARRLFDEMPVRDAVSWGTLLAGYSRCNQCGLAIELFYQMVLGSGLEPDDVALVSVLSCCARLGALEHGERVHEYVKRKRTRLSVYLATGLVDMYAKCGRIGVAREVFELSPEKNLFTWNAMIVGLAMHGDGELALEYFGRMREAGVWPDGVSFLGVLVGCSHAGLVGTARRVFDEMSRVYGVKRELKHYGCLADLLGRAGLIGEAMEMIGRMPMEGDAYVWGGVLGGCRLHGNVDVAEVAARHLLKLNPEDSGIYSIMADIYANARRWEDVARMRKLMNDRNVKKNVGCSSIQVHRASLQHMQL